MNYMLLNTGSDFPVYTDSEDGLFRVFSGLIVVRLAYIGEVSTAPIG